VFLQPFIIKKQHAKIVHAYKKTIEYKTIGSKSTEDKNVKQ